MNTTLEYLFMELSNIYLSRDIKSVSEIYGQRFCVCVCVCVYIRRKNNFKNNLYI
jgi:hypothetical protein